ncbi:MAG: sigma-70 family RNA polymerase sigma factor [Blautia sp.]|nr:sigma-70 family RNA polymerase sigma factor [Blautia sp.]
MKQLSILRERLPEPLPEEQEKRLLAMLCTDYRQKARELLILHNLRLVFYTAGQYYDRGNVFKNGEIGFEDLVSEGIIGLIKAADSFDEKRAVRFGTYAGRCIYHEMQMYVRRQKQIGREYPGYVLYGPEPGRSGEAAEEQVLALLEKRRRTALLGSAVAGLSPEEQKMLYLRYGEENEKRLTQQKTAAVLGVSQSYLSRMEKRTLRKLRLGLEEAGIG